ncbi:MAG TPA: hypothetical protein VM534_06340 [Thermoanaerobaculia bacterium]|nr:hypothetical protein [Thermoanaerobaculia bacterium]
MGLAGSAAAVPTVGEPFAIDYPIEQGARLLPDPGQSQDWEVISQNGSHVVLRAFRPGDLELRFEIVDRFGRARSLVIPQTIQSVLAEGETDPSPLSGPVPPRIQPIGWILPAVAALAALLLWLPLLRVGKVVEKEGSPIRRLTFREELERIRALEPNAKRYTELADALRALLPELDGDLGRELTSAEIIEMTRLRMSRRYGEALAVVLRFGDREKFSGWGADPSRFDEVFMLAEQFVSLESREVAA